MEGSTTRLINDYDFDAVHPLYRISFYTWIRRFLHHVDVANSVFYMMQQWISPRYLRHNVTTSLPVGISTRYYAASTLCSRICHSAIDTLI
jgi:uncharacterized membrane protein (DUF106 family)